MIYIPRLISLAPSMSPSDPGDSSSAAVQTRSVHPTSQPCHDLGYTTSSGGGKKTFHVRFSYYDITNDKIILQSTLETPSCFKHDTNPFLIWFDKNLSSRASSSHVKSQIGDAFNKWYDHPRCMYGAPMTNYEGYHWPQRSLAVHGRMSNDPMWGAGNALKSAITRMRHMMDNENVTITVYS